MNDNVNDIAPVDRGEEDQLRHCAADNQSDVPAEEPSVAEIAPDQGDVAEVGGQAEQDIPAEQSPAPKSRARSLSLKIAVTGVFAALSYGLYLLGKFCKLPFMFPSFLDMQFSELPALIVGFALGPVYGGAVIVVKCLLKMPMTSTGCVGELTDIVLGLLFVLPGTILYRFRRNLKGAVWGAVLGSVVMTAGAILINRFVSIPFYLKTFFGGNWAPLLGMLKSLFPNITRQNFYHYYLWGSVLPFNLLRCVIMCLLTFAVYKRLSKLIHRITR